MGKNKTLTILGLGNTLLGDEGFGVHFVQWFAERHCLPPDVAIVDGGTMGYMLMETICNSQTLIVIDCLKTDDTPGSLYRFTREQLEERLPSPTSAHEVKFADVLCKAEMLGESPDLVFFCVVPDRHGDMNLALSTALRERFPALEALLLKELADLGICPEKRHA